MSIPFYPVVQQKHTESKPRYPAAAPNRYPCTRTRHLPQHPDSVKEPRHVMMSSSSSFKSKPRSRPRLSLPASLIPSSVTNLVFFLAGASVLPLLSPSMANRAALAALSGSPTATAAAAVLCSPICVRPSRIRVNLSRRSLPQPSPPDGAAPAPSRAAAAMSVKDEDVDKVPLLLSRRLRLCTGPSWT